MHLIPGVTHRCVHITDVQLVWGGQHTFGHQVTAADHKLSGTNINLFDRQWQQRQILLHMAAAPGEVLNRACQHGSAVQPTTQPAGFSINQSSQLRLAAQVSQKGINLFNDLFGTPNRAGREPFMNQSDALREVVRSRRHPAE